MANIIIADDDEMMRLLMSQSLQRSGHVVRVAKNGIEGLEMAFIQVPDLFITDANMPGINGVAAVEELRAAGIHVPAILVTAGSDLIENLPPIENLLCIAKPITPGKFSSFVNQILDDSVH